MESLSLRLSRRGAEFVSPYIQTEVRQLEERLCPSATSISVVSTLTTSNVVQQDTHQVQPNGARVDTYQRSETMDVARYTGNGYGDDRGTMTVSDGLHHEHLVMTSQNVTYTSPDGSGWSMFVSHNDRLVENAQAQTNASPGGNVTRTNSADSTHHVSHYVSNSQWNGRGSYVSDSSERSSNDELSFYTYTSQFGTVTYEYDSTHERHERSEYQNGYRNDGFGNGLSRNTSFVTTTGRDTWSNTTYDLTGVRITREETQYVGTDNRFNESWWSNDRTSYSSNLHVTTNRSLVTRYDESYPTPSRIDTAQYVAITPPSLGEVDFLYSLYQTGSNDFQDHVTSLSRRAKHQALVLYSRV